MDPTQPRMLRQGPNLTHSSHTYVKCRHQYCRTHIFTCPLFHNYVSSKMKERECRSVLPVFCSGSKKAKFKGKNNLRLNVKIKGNEKYEFTVFSYNATVLLIQPNPTHHMCWKMRPNPAHGWTQPMSISE